MLDAVIVEPSLDNRTNLREIARNFCNSVLVSSSLQDGLERIRNSKNCDVIYVSSRFDLELASQFVVSAKQTEPGKDSANLLIGSSENFNEAYLARLTLKGFDGMLLEPASVETFKASAELALKVRKQKLAQRQKRSIDVLLNALADQLDELSLKKKLGHITILSEDRFKSLGKEIKTLDINAQEIYFNSLLELFPSRQAPIQKNVEAYSGSSQRVQRRTLFK